ncbi:hypothetical protein HaLaN_26128 [Haematococcus lacustris]|uniref:Uncharacterized protein n=1 Tax=Haematococcus lacustris TaxID=44745 RepID=A0A6A0A5G9_HAELA|nr:hypothetical protein HaLaN_26128 [Haematococcus lacustris]
MNPLDLLTTPGDAAWMVEHPRCGCVNQPVACTSSTLPSSLQRSLLLNEVTPYPSLMTAFEGLYKALPIPWQGQPSQKAPELAKQLQTVASKFLSYCAIVVAGGH